jgi:hypothetical protein
MNLLDYIVVLAFIGAFAAVLWVSRRNGKRLTEADKMAAGWVARQVRDYGPLSQAQLRQAAAGARARGNDRRRGRENRMLAHGLTTMAGEMRPGERVTGTVPWWRRL